MKKRYIASFDAGTTAVKGVLADENGTVAAERAVNIPTIFDGGVQEQDPACWWIFRPQVRMWVKTEPLPKHSTLKLFS